MHRLKGNSDMFTQAKVRTVSDCARLLSGGVYGLQAMGASLGSGVRYIDGRRWMVWLGSRGARQAASYYLGVADAFNPGVVGDLPEEVNAVRAELLNSNRLDHAWYNQGHSDANGFLSWGIERHDFSLAALQAMPNLGDTHFADVKFSTGGYRLSLSRMTVADGAPYDHQVTVEKIETVDGRNNWVTVREYQAK